MSTFDNLGWSKLELHVSLAHELGLSDSDGRCFASEALENPEKSIKISVKKLYCLFSQEN